jgi:hypothetical protein
MSDIRNNTVFLSTPALLEQPDPASWSRLMLLYEPPADQLFPVGVLCVVLAVWGRYLYRVIRLKVRQLLPEK